MTGTTIAFGDRDARVYGLARDDVAVLFAGGDPIVAPTAADLFDLEIEPLGPAIEVSLPGVTIAPAVAPA